MPANSNAAQPALDDAMQAANATRAKFDDAVNEFRDRAGQVAQETLETLRTRARPYVDDAGQRLQNAEKYLVDQVQKQPLTTTLAILGVGVLVGLVLASGRNSR